MTSKTDPGSPSRPPRFSLRLLAIFLGLTLAITFLGWRYLKVSRTRIREEAGHNLLAIADLKSSQIVQWRRERLADARVIAENALLTDAITSWQEDPRRKDLEHKLSQWLESLKKNYQYSAILLLDGEARLRMVAPAEGVVLGDIERRMALKSLSDRNIFISELYRNPGETKIHQDLYVPIQGSPGARGAAIVILQIDPDLYLYSMIQSWPTPSPSAESLLVRREGDEVVYLNEVRHRKNTALNLRVPSDAPRLPAAMAVRGVTGAVDGVDYQGRDVVAVLRPVPESDWFLICKIDLQEIYLPFHRQAWWAGLVMLALILLSAAWTRFLWKRRQDRWMLDQQKALRESEMRLNRAQEIAHLGSWELDLATNRLTWSDEVYRIFGLKPQEFSATYDAFLGAIHPDDRAAVDAAYAASIREGQDGYAIEHRVVRKTTGEVRIVHEKCDHLRDDSGKIIRSVGMVHDITERRLAEERILKETQFSEFLINSLPGVFYAINTEAKFIKTNLRFAEVTGFTADEIAGMQVLDFFPAEEKGLVASRIGEVFEKGSSFVEAHFLTKGGDRIPHFFTGARIMRDGVPLLIGMGMDITERKKAEEELHQTLQHLNNLYDYANAPIICWDTQFRITRFNRAFERLTRYPAQEVLGHNLEMLFPPDTREDSLARIRETLGGEHWNVVEIPIRRKDGEVRIALWNSANIYAEDGKTPIETIAQGQDITQRKRAEEELRKALQYLNNLYDYANAPIICWDTQFRITRFNRAFERLTTYRAPEVLGRPLGMLFPPDTREESLARIQDTLAGENMEVVEIPIRRKDGEVRIALWNSANIYAADGKTPRETIAQGQDITFRKRAEEELRRSNENLEQFAYVASHDLQEPLRMMASYSQLLERRYKDKLDSDADEFIGFIVDGAGRMQRLINDLLAYSRVGRVEKSSVTVDCAAVLDRVIAGLTPAAEEAGARITHEGLPVVEGSESEFIQLFQNLVGNALKFRGEEPPRIHVGAFKRSDEWVFSIRDNGIGIEPQYRDRIFLIFQRLHGRSEYPGTGIGLAICKKIVETWGGQIWVESEPGKGSTFFFTLPPRKGEMHDER